MKVSSDLYEFRGDHYIIVTDYHSKFFEFRKLLDECSRSTIEAHKEIFSTHGSPEVVMSDNGPQYSSREFSRFSKEWNFLHITSSPRYPRSNGLAERSVQTIKNIFR
jgi:transposase InsO family protein